MCYVPSLQSLCVKILAQYPNQIHALESARLQYEPPENDGAHDLLRELIPAYRYDPETQDTDLLEMVDPRLWATLVQIYDSLPETFRTYQLPLSDTHLPLLQDVPCTPHFALITTLSIRGRSELDDSNIAELGQLHGLTALDVGATTLTPWGVKTLAKTLVKRTSGTRALSGPWPLRLLSLRDCMKINDEVLTSLAQFPLLSVIGESTFELTTVTVHINVVAIDLRGTRCTTSAYRKTSFLPSADDSLYHPTPLRDALAALAKTSVTGSFYSHPEPFYIHINSLAHKPLSRASSYSSILSHNRVSTVPRGASTR